ncbi:glycerol-3-phosphate acyltransferase 1, mitochondrial isoform X2 [Octopus sinensis]|uniref:Glycerol-3-phosphate acyltransferase 1, mitochondrial isoform X2 n=1 Tax=Octopus sinensis TaxID=2607531 RepID=A0A7E6F9U6_9MOLL|nr:glycerol-3-phosphate acyltransferase 1, mitochondrial isoform X2 [Octopus sinensis]
MMITTKMSNVAIMNSIAHRICARIMSSANIHTHNYPTGDTWDNECFASKGQRKYSDKYMNRTNRQKSQNNRLSHTDAKIIEQGKQRWQDKCNSLVTSRTQKKKETKPQTVNLNVDFLANFKIAPVVKADQLVSYRTFMGFTCPCFPESRKNITSENILQDSLQNVLNIRSELRHPNRFELLFPYLAYSLQRKSPYVYPDLSLSVLISSRVQDAVQQNVQKTIESEPNAKMEKILKIEKQRSKKIIDRMKACISYWSVSLFGYSLFKFLGLILRSLQVHRSQLNIIKDLEQKGHPIIFLPLHKSHLDYIIVTWILWIHDMRVPYVAAGDNLNIPIIGPILRALGGFFIRRRLDTNGKRDLIYRSVLQSYMQELLQEGQSLEFFIEGGRSRSGKALYPKGGLLSVIVDSFLQSCIQDAYIVPISISYEKLMEGNFIDEQMGLPKQKESVWGTIRALLHLFYGDYGNIRVEFPQPFSLKEFIESYNIDNNIVMPNLLPALTPPVNGVSPSSMSSSLSSSTSLCMFNVSKEARDLVQSLAEHIVYSSVCSTVLMSTNILAFLLLTKYRQGATLKELADSFKELTDLVKSRNRDIGFSGKSEDIVLYAAAMLGSNVLKRSFTEIGDVYFKPAISLPSVFSLSYNSAPVTNVFAMESVIVGACFYAGNFSLSDVGNSMQRTDISVKREELFAASQVLCQLFKFEYILSLGCMQIDDIITDALDLLVMDEVLRIPALEVTNRSSKKGIDIFSLGDEDDFLQTNNTLMVNTSQDECIEKLKFYQQVLMPVCESYLVTANHVKTLMDSDMEEEKFMTSLHNNAKERAQRNLTKCSESAAQETLKNAVRALHDLRIITTYHRDGDKNNPKLVSLLWENDVRQRLYDLIDLLEHMRE